MITIPTPFDFVNSISYSKKDLMCADELAEKLYNQFIVNKALSYFPDTIFFVNELNVRNVDNRQHFTYLLQAIPRKKRFSKWFKLEDTDTIQLIQEHYNYSYSKAKEALKLLSDDQIKQIRDQYYKGGVS